MDIQCVVCFSNSKTTFVTVNLLNNAVAKPKETYSKTTFVTVNLIFQSKKHIYN